MRSRIATLLFHDVWIYQRSESGFQGRAADRYKVQTRSFREHLESIARVRRDAPVLIRHGADCVRGQRSYAFTVDDGGVSYYSLMAEQLEALGWRGHCLVTTGFIGSRGFLDPPQIRELHRRGHVIGTHSVSHPDRFHRCTWPKMVSEWRDSRKHLEDIIGERVTVGSVPGGYYSRRVAQSAREADLEVLFSSEPETRPRLVAGCTVLGRFAIRSDSTPVMSRMVVQMNSAVLLREWATWNGKKLAKVFLGNRYRSVAGPLADPVPQIFHRSSRQ